MYSHAEHAPLSRERKKKSNDQDYAVSMPSQVFVRAQLEVTKPGDTDEEEADSTADSIVREGKIARSVSNGHPGGGIALPSHMGSRLASLQGHGSPLSDSLKSRMEAGFGRDFSQVRLHTDSAAAEMSESISAKAFTYGDDIYFNRGQFNPGTTAGQHLIAHELTHVAQGSPSVRRKPKDDAGSSLAVTVENEEISPNNNLWLDPESYKTTFPEGVDAFDERSKNNLDKVADKVMSSVAQFMPFAYGFSLDYHQSKDKVDLPDIKSLLKYCDQLLLYKGKSRLRNYSGETVIGLTHPEVRRFLMERLSDDIVDLFYLWMKYSPEQGSSNSLSKALGLRPLDAKDFVKHEYTLTFMESSGLSYLKFIGARVAVTTYKISYRNNLGLKWSMVVDRKHAGISAGGGVGLPDEQKECIGGDCASKPEVSKKWFSPYDFAHSNASMGLNAEVHAGSIYDTSVSAGFVTVNMPGKGELIFDMTGIVFTKGRQAGVEAEFGMSGSLGFSNASDVEQNAEPSLNSPRTDYPLTAEPYSMGSARLYFPTGSANVYSEDYGAENEKVLSGIVKIAEEAYRISRDAGTFDGIFFDVFGKASPLWKSAKGEYRELWNLELSQARAEAAVRALRKKMSPEDDSAISFLVNSKDSARMGTPIELIESTQMETFGEGDEEGMRDTKNDITNNDANYRRVDITVYLMLKRSRQGLS